MDIQSESDSQLMDHLNKCRFCFNVFKHEEEIFKITKIIEKQFLELTQTELKSSICYSRKVCELCKIELNNFINLKNNFVSKQEKLYEYFGEHPVKKEEEFVESNLDEFEPIVEVKTESFESVFEEEDTLEDRLHSYVVMNDGIFDISEKIEDQTIDNTDQISDSCPNCFKSFYLKSPKNHDIEVIHLDSKKFNCDPIQSINCDQCDCRNLRGKRLVVNTQIPEPKNTRKKRYKEKKMCQQCGTSVLDLSRHIKKVHSKIINYYCDICGLGTLFKSSLDSHMKVHMKKDKREFNCDSCGKQFEKRHILNRHIRLKHSEKERKHPCTVCNKSFFTNSDLKKHFESHQGKIMPCEFCGKLFSCMNNLRTHLVYHQDPKFICTFEGCNKKFFARKLLRAHTKVHQGQKDYACEYCDKKYYFSSHVKRHIRNFHMHLKMDCEIAGCSSTFARKETYRNHVLSHHKELPAEFIEDLLQRIRIMKAEDYIVCPP